MTKNKQRLDLIPTALRCIACGAVTGTVIFFFKYAASKTETLSRLLYEKGRENPMLIPIILGTVLLFAGLIYLLHKKAPEVRGGGIPRSEGILRGILSCRPVVTLFGTALGSLIGFFCGLPLGSEGPAVLIGTSTGGIISGRNGENRASTRYVMTGGAAAGFAVATCAPLSAILFALEEIHKRITPLLILASSLSVLSATYTNKLLCGIFGQKAQLFELYNLSGFDIRVCVHLLLLGVIIAAAVAIFDSSIDRFTNLCARLSKGFPRGMGIVLVFAVCAILGFIFPEGLYSGHHIIEELVSGKEHAAMLVLILGVRLIMMLFMTGSGATGGIFIPTLAIGALVSALSSRLLLALGLPFEMYGTTVLLGMCAFIGGTLRAPLTSAVLFAELTGRFTDFFYVSLVVFTVIFITDILNLVPFYDKVLEQLEKAHHLGKERRVRYFSLVVTKDAFAVGKSVRDILWPHASVVVGIRRSGEDIDGTDNDGEKIVRSGDRIVIRARYYDEALLMRQLTALAGEGCGVRRCELDSSGGIAEL